MTLLSGLACLASIPSADIATSRLIVIINEPTCSPATGSPSLILHLSMRSRNIFHGCTPPASSSLPMSHEVLLFQGLPNGWLYLTDYKATEEACKEFVAVRWKVNDLSQHLKPEVQRKRPLAPSIH
ncbi:hypothetical protein BT96DRAFT_1006697 [Gymnopus androsaceus JB14]|uniref:Uncharacterized protein n=1 Tax=Gymnopus androsaceus JB14 TaxID=1447944 RepID=A0A6A4GKJ4_9AGAR|nr:hypothetical protein BT96DRAFT_1006697 [Gymnopus androsaceus JB14]